MSPSRLALAIAGVASLVACSANDRRLRIETWPQGANVRVGDAGRIEGQTPVPSLHVVVPDDGFVVLLIEKDGYQTVAYKLDEKSPDLLFFPLEIAPDLERLGATIKALQSSIEGVSKSVNSLRTDLQRSGSK
jgi:hypothetical protein